MERHRDDRVDGQPAREIAGKFECDERPEILLPEEIRKAAEKPLLRLTTLTTAPSTGFPVSSVTVTIERTMSYAAPVGEQAGRREAPSGCVLAIGDYLGEGNTYYENDFGAIATGAVPVSHDHDPAGSGGP